MARFCPEDFEEYATVEYVTETTDGAGGYTDAWTERVGIWCMVEAAGGGESIIAGRLEHTDGYVLTTHYNSAILATDRVVLDSENYKITRLEDVDRKQEFLKIYIESGRT